MKTPPAPNMSKPRPWRRTRGFWLCVLGLVSAILLARYYGWLGKSDEQLNSPLPVVTAVTHTGQVPVTIAALGAVTPTYSVTVKTQINGRLLRVLFREGQWVKAGELLAEVDPRTYQAQLLQYQGQLERDMALLTNAQLDLKRYQRLWHQDSVSQQTLATQQALVKQYEGAVQIDQGLVAATQVSLSNCEITSPIDGRVGLRLVDPGNVVQTTDPNGIAVVNTLNPMTVIFSIPEDNIPEVVQQMNAGKTLLVEAYDRQQNQLLARGTLLTIDNQIDPTTGQVKLRAQFHNDKNTLFSNQFVNIKLVVNTLQNALLVPTAAVQYSGQNAYVYVVNTDYSVSAKSVTVGITSGDTTSITQGLAPRQYVVIEGADKLRDGAKITMTNLPSPILPVQTASIWQKWRKKL